MDYQVFRADTVEKAIALAEEFRQKGKYDWFRGQVKAWPPYSGKFRIRFKSEEEWQETGLPRFARFLQWLKITPGLEPILNDRDAVFAVAQHYGIPTDYIDFTTDPSVAGFFACDTAAPEPGGECCIYCLNIMDLKEVWELVSEVQPEVKELLGFVQLKVPNLWRLEAQRGVFLYCPTNWDVHYPMDRIIFPYTGYPPVPAKADIYPEIKSPLEILLDHYFLNETLLAGKKGFLKQLREEGVNPNTQWVVAEPPPENIRPDYLTGRTISRLSSWQSEEHHAWLAVREETIEGVRGAEARLHVGAGQPSEVVREGVAAGVRRLLGSQQGLRRKSVNWRIDGLPANVGAKLEAALRRMWDGMRIHPYEDRQIAQAAGVCAALLLAGYPSDGFSGTGPAEDRKLASLVIGESIGVEFTSADGAYARGQAAEANLLAAVRSDIAECIEEQYRGRAGQIKFLLQVILAPDRLFEFDRLVELFATQLIPTQVLRAGPVVYYSPARLERFGLP